jgi:hypothetical protein
MDHRSTIRCSFPNCDWGFNSIVITLPSSPASSPSPTASSPPLRSLLFLPPTTHLLRAFHFDGSNPTPNSGIRTSQYCEEDRRSRVGGSSRGCRTSRHEEATDHRQDTISYNRRRFDDYHKQETRLGKLAQTNSPGARELQNLLEEQVRLRTQGSRGSGLRSRLDNSRQGYAGTGQEPLYILVNSGPPIPGGSFLFSSEKLQDESPVLGGL